MIKVFPELRGSTDINFMEPTKKGLKRVPCSDPMPGLLSAGMQAHTRLSDLVRHNLAEVAGYGLRNSPTFLSQTMSHSDFLNSRIDSMMRGRGAQNRAEFRIQIMQELLASPPPSPPVAKTCRHPFADGADSGMNSDSNNPFSEDKGPVQGNKEMSKRTNPFSEDTRASGNTTYPVGEKQQPDTERKNPFEETERSQRELGSMDRSNTNPFDDADAYKSSSNPFEF